MADDYITCPNCSAKIQLTQALTLNIEERLRKDIAGEYDIIAEKERVKIEKEAKITAEKEVSVRMLDLQEEVKEKSGKLKGLEEQELALRKDKRQLEERAENLELEVARKIDEETEKIKNAATEKALESYRLKEKEKDLQIEGFKKQLDDLNRKLEQRSQQAQGEAQEVELEEILRQKFPYDEITPVNKGKKGADVLQIVNSSSGKNCGIIIWESKRTQAWSNGWVDKIKENQRDEKADIAVIVTATLPKDINRFDLVKGVWITDLPCTLALATALRENLIGISMSRLAQVGKSQKMDLLFEYLSGPEFGQRVQAIAEAFVALKKDLGDEKRAFEKMWSKREKQLELVIKNTAGMYGDVQGIIGSSLAELPILELPAGDDAGKTDEDLPF